MKKSCTEYTCYNHKGFESEDLVKCKKRNPVIIGQKCCDYVNRTEVQRAFNRRTSTKFKEEFKHGFKY